MSQPIVCYCRQRKSNACYARHNVSHVDFTYTAAMAVLAKLDVAFATEQRVAAFGSAGPV